MADRRQHLRGRPLIDLPAEIQLLPEDGVGFLHVVDISLGGAMCRLDDRDDEPAANSVAQLRLCLPGQSEPVIIIARVARVIAPGLLGIAFMDATKRDRSRMATWCQQQVLKRSTAMLGSIEQRRAQE